MIVKMEACLFIFHTPLTEISHHVASLVKGCCSACKYSKPSVDECFNV